MHRFRHHNNNNKPKQVTPVYKYNTVTQADLEKTSTNAVEEEQEVAAIAATSWWPWLIGLGFFLAAGIIVAAIFAALYFEHLFIFSKSGPTTLLQTDLSATCIGNNIDQSDQQLSILVYGQSRGYPYGGSMYASISGAAPTYLCPGIYGVGYYSNFAFPPLTYGFTGGAIVQDLSKEFYAALGYISFYSLPENGAQLLICGRDASASLLWSIGIGKQWHSSYAFFYSFSSSPTFWLENNIPIPTYGAANHLVFHYNPTSQTIALVLNNGSPVSYSGSIPVGTGSATVSFDIGCGGAYAGIISNVII